MKDAIVTGFVTFVAALMLMGVVALALGWLLALLWNTTLFQMFPATMPHIDWWMGTKLLFLCGLLFKSSSSSSSSN